MKLSNRQLVIGSLQPLLFCIGMYCVILIFSVFACSSLYHAFKSNKKTADTEARAVSAHQPVKQVAASFK
ncbi:hypothetical protein [Agriterribacter sp.]|uniref:hypothetical protein n=1 Tax=Agriterribacter sp. TaxID=2821509 RepID=UPI002C0214A2|nr:hypothetical protein [Agriterribacter sp.]HRP55942.1 hypothetical protein [Agriterribacter sp.]